MFTITFPSIKWGWCYHLPRRGLWQPNELAYAQYWKQHLTYVNNSSRYRTYSFSRCLTLIDSTLPFPSDAGPVHTTTTSLCTCLYQHTLPMWWFLAPSEHCQSEFGNLVQTSAWQPSKKLCQGLDFMCLAPQQHAVVQPNLQQHEWYGGQDAQRSHRGAVLMVAHEHQSRVLNASLPSDVLAGLGAINLRVRVLNLGCWLSCQSDLVSQEW